MTQIGLNTGPRTAQILAWAVSYVGKKDDSYKVANDEDIIAASSFLWSIILSIIPSEITQHVEKYLDDEKLPRIATRNVAEGFFMTFFHIFLFILIYKVLGTDLLLGARLTISPRKKEDLQKYI